MANTESKFSTKEFIKYLIYNFVGSYLYAAGVHVFTRPHNFAPGGITGIATILNYLFDFPIGIGVTILNLPLVFLAAKFISKSFAIKTIGSLAIFTFCADYLVKFLPQYNGDALLASLFGGAIMGVGLAAIYLSGSTTGGTVIIGVLLKKLLPHIPIGKLGFAVDFFVVGISIFVFKNIDAALYAVLNIFTANKFMDSIVYGKNTNKLIFIITNKSDEVKSKIISEIKRGVTLLEGEGGYDHSKKNIIMCVVSKAQFVKVKDLAKQLDDNAFIIVSDAGDIYGKGFIHY